MALELCGLEETQQTRVLIGPPEEYVHGHTLPIMLTQMIGGTPAGEVAYRTGVSMIETYAYICMWIGLKCP